MPPKFSRELEERTIYPERYEKQERTSPCEVACPAGNPIQKSHGLVKEGMIEDALSYIRSRNPFPSITGRICAHPCEDSCNRGNHDEVISIKALERCVSEKADPAFLGKPKKEGPTGKRLAIIGAGPSGLTCAYFSALFGHEVTVFDAAPMPGGIPRLLVPDFRLPKDVVDREIGQILELGVSIVSNTKVGRDIDFSKIMAEYDACLMATGAWKAKRPDFPGAESAIPGTEFLRQVNLGNRTYIGEKVVIIGGGGVAFDCAFTVKRLGASDIKILCVEGPDNMCAPKEDIEQARLENIDIKHSRLVTEVSRNGDGRFLVKHRKVSSFNFDEKGTLSAVTEEGEIEIIVADRVISAIGVQPDLDFLGDGFNLKGTPKGTLYVHPDTYMTSKTGLFAAGDVVSGPSTVAHAIGSGRHAAVAIDSYLRGKGFDGREKIIINGEGHIVRKAMEGQIVPHVVEYHEIMNADFFEKKGRVKTIKIPVDGMVTAFQEMEKGLDLDEAKTEASRCMHCGHCTLCGCCVENCPGLVLTMTKKGPEPTYYDECWHCGCCRIACPGGAVYYEFPLNMLV
ncbi:MAG: FAD-dependent oxidoreductase [Syntrophorhabdaceae bacterium]|nr:FAD-dependent oxidoreductase [Syntrophorhabdaceae bacterium]